MRVISMYIDFSSICCNKSFVSKQKAEKPTIISDCFGFNSCNNGALQSLHGAKRP